MSKILNPTFGSDIEFFIQTRRGDPIPAIGLVGGTKEKPRALGQGYFIQEDNVAVEFNIPICKTTKEFAIAVSRGYSKCMEQLPPSFVPMENCASQEFAIEYLQHPKASEFGCEPDINAWTREVNPRPQCKNRALRSAGGHIHIGWDNPDMETRFELIKACDVFASIPAMHEDGDKRRRELYGKAGAMRIKPYGVEHRVLSNYWMFDQNMAHMVISRYLEAIEFINYGHRIEEADSQAIVEAINNSNAKQAGVFYKKYRDKWYVDRLGLKKSKAKEPDVSNYVFSSSTTATLRAR